MGTPFLKLQSEIKKASGEQDDAVFKEEALGSMKAEGGFWEPFWRVVRMFNPVTMPQRILAFFKEVKDFLKKPSWIHLSEKIGSQNVQKRPLRLCPSNQDCKDHGAETVQKCVVVSCLFFFLPGVMYLWQLILPGIRCLYQLKSWEVALVHS